MVLVVLGGLDCEFYYDSLEPKHNRLLNIITDNNKMKMNILTLFY
jgi:hypothetical protein